MSKHWQQSKQPERAMEENLHTAEESHFGQILSDTNCFEQALREYRETNWDDSSFEELLLEAQQSILRRAQEIKGSQHRLQTVFGVRHPIAS